MFSSGHRPAKSGYSVGLTIHYGAHSAAEPQPKKEKADLTTKDTKSTKFMRKNIGTLRGLRDLRGENISRHVLHP
jgi:hypothetical protein